MALQLRSHYRKTLQNPCFSRFFSSSSSNAGEDDKTPPSPSPSPSPSSYLSSVKASLRQSSPPRSRNLDYPPPFPPPKPSKISSLQEIGKNLSEFRRRSAAPPSPGGRDSSSPLTFSFQDLYKRNVTGQTPTGNADGSTEIKRSLDSVRESLRQLRASSPAVDRSKRAQEDSRPSPLSLTALKESLQLKPSDVSPGVSSDSLRTSLFGRGTGEAKTEADAQASRTEFLTVYTHEELGKKLKQLRPPESQSKKKKDWFSLEELNERLKKLREIEEESESRVGGLPFKDLRDCLVKMKNATDDSMKKKSMQKLNILAQLGGQVTPNFMLSPPKEELVEKYFHPDNMSSAEKLKLELKKVREEFKMSESDCGSSRVQVALLTTKIKHLSSVLHKKDKHSRKGLQAMVQRRKKLLKYLRRTDWVSYCFVLSKLGLRDNPDFKY